MKNIILTVVFILVAAVGIFGQNSTDSCCCPPQPVSVSGHVYSGDLRLTQRNVVAIAVYNITLDGTLISYKLVPVGLFGNFNVASTTCTYTVVQPVLSAYGQKLYPVSKYAFGSSAQQFFAQLQTDTYVEFELSLMQY